MLQGENALTVKQFDNVAQLILLLAILVLNSIGKYMLFSAIIPKLHEKEVMEEVYSRVWLTLFLSSR